MLTKLTMMITTLLIMNKQPIKTGMTLLVLSLTILMSIFKKMNPILSFFIFLIYISGLLILFFYFSALDQQSSKPTTTKMTKLMLPIVTLLFMMPMYNNINISPLLATSSYTWPFMNNFNYIMNVTFLLIALLMLFLFLLDKKNKALRKSQFLFLSMTYYYIFLTKSKSNSNIILTPNNKPDNKCLFNAPTSLNIFLVTYMTIHPNPNLPLLYMYMYIIADSF